jgi:hypothetical protein
VLTADKIPQVERLILIAPALDFVDRYFRSLTTDELGRWKETGYITLYHYQYKTEKRLGYGMVKDAENYRTGKRDRNPNTLIFHGIRDESVPYQVSINYLNQNPNSRLMLLNSDHGLIDQLDPMWRCMADYLELS